MSSNCFEILFRTKMLWLYWVIGSTPWVATKTVLDFKAGVAFLASYNDLFQSAIKASGGMPRDWAAAGITHINLDMEAQQPLQEPMKLTSYGVQVTPGYSQVAVCR